VRRILIAPSLLLLATSSCFPFDENDWASRDQIIEAARRCGVPDFEPTEVGDAWAAWVPDTVPDHAAKEDCIYGDMKRQNLLVTR
jgi:hypothetical protein